jgi:hypothetical protein
MSRSQRLISAFIVFQLLAITIGATQDPDGLVPPIPSDRSSLSLLGKALSPVLDRLEQPVLNLNAALWGATSWLRYITTPYLLATRQFELWNMFSRPGRNDDYICLRYYVTSEGSSLLRVHRELIYPAHPEGQMRLFQSYSDSFRDKAIALALESYANVLVRERKRTSEAEALERAQQKLVPVIGAFARRFNERNLGQGERLIRADLWKGSAATGPPGHVTEPGTLAARRAILEAYDAETDLSLLSNKLPDVGARLREVDIDWTLLGRVTWK